MSHFKHPIDNFTMRKYPDGSVTQWFGENPDLYKRFGLDGHNGHDYVAPHGTPLYAVEDCIVLEVKLSDDGYGKHVRLLSLDRDSNQISREWTYGHCDTISTRQGRIVRAGEQIATMGNTGFVVSGSTPYWKSNPYAGTHLHLGLRMAKVVEKGGWSYPNSPVKMKTQDYDNGYMGGVDPYPFLAGLSQSETRYRKQLLTVVSLLNKFISLWKAKNIN